MLPECKPLRCLAAGAGTGLLTGFLGVGGGFLLVPALMKYARLPLRMATGTSLAVIAFNSAAGFLSHLRGELGDWRTAGIFAACATGGSLLGNRVAKRLAVVRLRQGFAVVVLVTGGWILWRTV